MDPILLVDDDIELCQMLAEYLQLEGFEVEQAHDGESGLARALKHPYAVIVLDVMMPGLNGFDTLKALRQHSSTPVLMMSARGEEVDRIVGLEIGADDYLPKPCSPRELLARIKAITRRVAMEQQARGDDAEPDQLRLGRLEIDADAHSARVDGQRLELTHTEFLILLALAEATGKLVTRDKLMRRALNRHLGPFDRSIDMHLSNLRRKLGDPAQAGVEIRTVRGAGYMLLPADADDA